MVCIRRTPATPNGQGLLLLLLLLELLLLLLELCLQRGTFNISCV